MKFIAVVFSILFSASGFSQTIPDSLKGWKYTGLSQLNFNQVSLSNWAGGGQSSIAGMAAVHLTADRRWDKTFFENKLDVGYGLIRQAQARDYQKTDDDLKFLSKCSHKLSGDWNEVVLGDFKTTMTPGYLYKKNAAGELVRDVMLSKFMAPGYLITSLGAEYRPNDKFFVMIAPVSGKFTFVLDRALADSGAFGVEKGKEVRAEFGANVKSVLKYPIMKNVEFQNEIGLFDNYKTLDKVDVDWIAGLLMKANEYFTASVNTHLIYDDDIKIKRDNGTVRPSVQFKEVIALGLQYKF